MERAFLSGLACLLTLAALLVLPAPFAAAATDRVIVKLRTGGPGVAAGKPAPTATTLTQRLNDIGARTELGMRPLRQIATDTQVVQLDLVSAGTELTLALARLRADPAVEFAEPDARMRPHRVPSDPGFAEQWFLPAPVPGANGRTASAVDAVTAWDTTLGSAAVIVAVIDTGVRFEHPDLRRVGEGGKFLPGYDFVGTDANGAARAANDGDGWDPDPSDPGDWISSQDRQFSIFADCTVESSSWHGTRVSGLLAGLTDNGAGIAGVGWGNSIQPIRVLGKCGGYTSDVIAGMRWAAGIVLPGVPANPTPARVLNLSLGGQGTCSSAYQAAIDEITARGVLVVVSAGNDGALTDEPGNCRGVLSVTGIRHVGTKVGFANLGPDVAIAAPGGNCVNVGFGEPCLYSLDTTTNLGSTVPAANSYTDRIVNINVGTSFAAPIVAGIAALMVSVNGNLAPGEATERLQASALPFPVSSDPRVPTCRVPSSDLDTQLAECSCTTTTCGAGMVHAPGAVAAALRPIAVVTAPATADAGATVSLSATGSVGADGRIIAGYAWTLLSGATSLSALAGNSTSFVAPGISGDVVVRLTVTDDQGRSDSTDARVAVAGAPPPPPPIVVPPIGGGGRGGGGGGGLVDAGLLALLLAMGLVAGRRQVTLPRATRCAYRSIRPGAKRHRKSVATKPSELAARKNSIIGP